MQPHVRLASLRPDNTDLRPLCEPYGGLLSWQGHGQAPVLTGLAGSLCALGVALTLIGTGGLKLLALARLQSTRSGLFATGLPLGVARTATVAVAACEWTLALGLAFTRDATFVLSTLLFWLAALAFSVYLDQASPGSGCGCFGVSGQQDEGVASIRKKVIGLAVLATVTAGALARAGSSLPGWLTVASIASAIGVSFLWNLRSLRPPVDCVHGDVRQSVALARLRGDAEWRRRSKAGSRLQVTDDWREGCWWYFAFQELDSSREVVFAVALHPRRSEVRVGVVEPDPTLTQV